MGSATLPTLTSSTVRLSPSTPTPRALPPRPREIRDLHSRAPALPPSERRLPSSGGQTQGDSPGGPRGVEGEGVEEWRIGGALRCDDSVCLFTEAAVEETLEEVGAMEGCVGLSGMEAAGLSGDGIFSVEEQEEIPPLVIQVTSFKCKSIALAVN